MGWRDSWCNMAELEMWREGKVEGGSLRPVSVVPITAPLLFLNPAVLVDVTTIL